jgi:hypothetical protein
MFDRVVLGQWKAFDAADVYEVLPTANQIGEQAVGTAISVFRIFLEKLYYNSGDGLWDGDVELGWWRRLARHMTVNNIQRMVTGKWKCPGQQAIKYDAHGVQVSPSVDLSIDSAGLFRC